MDLPFTVEEFFDVFGQYHAAFPYAATVLTALGAIVVILYFVRTGVAAKLQLVILAMMWAWAGAAYHIASFAAINPAAYTFGALFIVQALILFWYAFVRERNVVAPAAGLRSASAAALIAYALVLYPVIGALAGHSYPRTPTFGLPCPLTIFTFGILLSFRGRVPAYLYFIPIVWSLIGSSAFILFGVWQDAALPVAATIAIAFLFFDRRSSRFVRTGEAR